MFFSPFGGQWNNKLTYKLLMTCSWAKGHKNKYTYICTVCKDWFSTFGNTVIVQHISFKMVILTGPWLWYVLWSNNWRIWWLKPIKYVIIILIPHRLFNDACFHICNYLMQVSYHLYRNWSWMACKEKYYEKFLVLFLSQLFNDLYYFLILHRWCGSAFFVSNRRAAISGSFSSKLIA